MMIYADHNATSPISQNIREYLEKRMQQGDMFANPHSLHSLGKKVEHAITKSREYCADFLGCSSHQIIFNSGASEGIAHIFYSVLSQTSKKTIVISNQEHAAVDETARHYETQGYKIIRISSHENGLINMNDLKEAITKNKNDLALVSIIAANNETGVIQPYQEIAKICQAHQIPFFPDTTQIIGKMNFHFTASGIDYAVLSSHKLGALTGSGLIIVKDPTLLIPMIRGGYQEGNKRAGTPHYIGIETLALAMSEASQNLQEAETLRKSKEAFEKKLKEKFSQVYIFGEHSPRLAGTSLIGFRGVHGQAVQLELESHNIFVTTSSACSDNEPETSKVLKSMGVHDDLGRSAIRISLKLAQNPSDFETIGNKLEAIYTKLSKIKY